MCRTAFVGIFLTAVLPAYAASQAMPRAIQCSEIKGSAMSAPDWQPDKDGASGQTVRIEFLGDGKPAKVQWGRDNTAPYTDMSGLAMSMKSGFVVLVVQDDYLETYTYNAGTTELLFTQTRSGSSLLPNSMKMFRGRCSVGK